MERKTYGGSVKLSAEGRGSAVIATLNVVDKDGDVTLPGAFGKQKAHLMPMHVWQSADPPFLGMADIRETGNEAIAEFKLNLELEAAQKWRDALKFALDNGLTVEWSYGFNIVDAEQGNLDGRPVRILKKLRVFEVSPVLLGAGVNTRTLAMKSAGEHVYVRIPQRSIDPRKLAIARLALDYAKSVLGLPAAPSIYWFAPATPEDQKILVELDHFKSAVPLKGQYYWGEPSMIRVSARLGESELIGTVLHEAAHFAGCDEDGAVAFTREHLKNFSSGAAAKQQVRREVSRPMHEQKDYYFVPGYDPMAR